MQRFVIFCASRTGSTTLVNILNSHPEIKCLSEPFNRDVHLGIWSHVKDRNSLRGALDIIWADYNGIKHVTDPSGWPFDHPDANHDLLGCADLRFILLTRRNMLRRALSEEIARQIEIWHPWSEFERARMHEFQFEPVDIDRLRSQLNDDAAFVEESRAHLRSNDAGYFDLEYESLFEPRSRAEQKAVLDDVVTFLGLPVFTDEYERQISHLLDPSFSASGSASVYRRIANIEEIERHLGCTETGWLFR